MKPLAVVVVVIAIALALLWRSRRERHRPMPGDARPPTRPPDASSATVRNHSLDELKGLLAAEDWDAECTTRWVTLVNKLMGTPDGWERHGASIGEAMDRWYETHPIVVEDTDTGLRITEPLKLDTKVMSESGKVRPWTALVRSLDFREHGVHRTEFGTSSHDVGLSEVLPLLIGGKWSRLESFDPTSLHIEDADAVDAMLAVLVEAPRLRHLVLWQVVFDLGDAKPGSKEAQSAFANSCDDHVAHLRQLGEAPWAGRLETMVASEVFIDWDPGPAEAGLRALGAFANLRRLDVFNCIARKGTVEGLLSSRWDRLETMHLGYIASLGEEGFGPSDAMELFATTKQLPALKYLHARFKGVATDHSARDHLDQASFELR